MVKTKKQLRRERKLFPKKPHNTRPFTMEDYKALPVGELNETKKA
jgi:hypothetical protein